MIDKKIKEIYNQVKVWLLGLFGDKEEGLSTPLLFEDDDELSRIREEALSDPLYFSKLADPANSIFGATHHWDRNDDDRG